MSTESGYVSLSARQTVEEGGVLISKPVELIVEIPGKRYPIFLSEDYDGIPPSIGKSGIDGRIAVITDENVAAYQLSHLKSSFAKHGLTISENDIIMIKPGEITKNLDTVESIYSRLIDMHMDRRAAIVAFGGGVTGDIAGFAASTFMRGIRCIQIPTTLLAQVDSSIGGKTGVDFLGIKNIVGTFYQPVFVHINVNSLRTLPDRQYRSGMAEVVKHAVISGRQAFDRIMANVTQIMSKDPVQLMNTISESCTIKAGIVAQDEHELTGKRALLNFGHTFGHAIESASCFNLLHGECVALGMTAAFEMAIRMGMPVKSDADDVMRLLKTVGLPLKLNETTNVDKILDIMFHDKKTINSKLRFIVPKGIGRLTTIVIDDRALIRDSLLAVM